MFSDMPFWFGPLTRINFIFFIKITLFYFYVLKNLFFIRGINVKFIITLILSVCLIPKVCFTCPLPPFVVDYFDVCQRFMVYFVNNSEATFDLDVPHCFLN